VGEIPHHHRARLSYRNIDVCAFCVRKGKLFVPYEGLGLEALAHAEPRRAAWRFSWAMRTGFAAIGSRCPPAAARVMSRRNGAPAAPEAMRR
jgi:hypothetical protein